MAKFKVKDQIDCIVTWTYLIEADNEGEALAKFREGEHGPEIGEPEIEPIGSDQSTTVEKC